VQRLSQSDCVQLVQSGTCRRFLDRFAAEFVPTAHACAPVRLDSDADLVAMLTRLSEMTLLTRSAASVCGLSCSVSLPLVTSPWHGRSVYFHVQYFGAELSDALLHVEAQLRHVTAALHAERRVLLRFCFPLCVDLTSAARRISDSVLAGLEPLLTERTYLVGVNVESQAHVNS